MRIKRLYISAAHNFFGHHDRPPGDHATIETAEVRCVAGRGIEGDRFFDFKDDYKGQITFFADEIYQEICDRFGVRDIAPSVFRRNVLTIGADLNGLIGQEFALQDVRFLGTAECSPCYWMDRVFAPGTEKALKGRGGLRAKILSDGILRTEV